MADSGGIADGSLGFFTKGGALKSQKQESETLSKLTFSSTKAGETNAKAEPVDNATKFSEAISSVADRFNSAISDIATVINIDSENLKAAKKQVKDEIKALKELRAATTEGSKPDIIAAKDRYDKLSNSRSEISSRIAADNREISEKRVAGVRFGNSTEATFNLKPVELSNESAPIDSLNRKQISGLIKEKQTELAALQSQTKTVKTERARLEQVTSQLSTRLDEVKTKTLRGFDEASQLGSKIADQLRSGGLELFEGASLTNMRTAIAMKLIS